MEQYKLNYSGAEVNTAVQKSLEADTDGGIASKNWALQKSTSADTSKFLRADNNWSNTLTNTLNVSPTMLAGNYNEGIRIHAAGNDNSVIMLCGNDNTGDTGTSDKTWGIINQDGSFYISCGTGAHLKYYNSTWTIAGGEVEFAKQAHTSFNNAVVIGSYFPGEGTLQNLVDILRYSSGCMGSYSLSTAYGSIPAGWYNYIYIPHRTGGKNGTAQSDNCDWGSILLLGMTVNGQQWHIRHHGSILETKKFS